MIAVDTNITVRLITKDDQLQYEQSLELFTHYDIFIPDTVINLKRSHSKPQKIRFY
jgi:predicted nucleic-acid-binding protein